MADAGKLKHLNTETVRRALRGAGAMSKNQLARQTGLSFPTVSRTVDELVQAGELCESGVDNATGGRSAQLYMADPMHRLTLSVRLESGTLHWFVRALDGCCVEEGQDDAQGMALQGLERLLDERLARHGNLGAVAVGVDGAVNKGVVTEAFGHDELQGVNLKRHLEEHCGLPVAVENDMSVVACGYVARYAGPAQGVVCIYLGRLCAGAGVAVDGEVWNGACGFAGELYYLPGLRPDLDDANRYDKVDMLAYYAHLIQTYATVLNPERVVLYQNKYIDGHMDELRRRCTKVLPAHAIPQLEISAGFDADYEQGLAVLAQKLLDAGQLANAVP